MYFHLADNLRVFESIHSYTQISLQEWTKFLLVFRVVTQKLTQYTYKDLYWRKLNPKRNYQGPTGKASLYSMALSKWRVRITRGRMVGHADASFRGISTS